MDTRAQLPEEATKAARAPPEETQIVLLDLDERLAALCEQPEVAEQLATGLPHGWQPDRSAAGGLTPTPAWRVVTDEPQEDTSDVVDASKNDEAEETEEDDSDARYEALFETVRGTCAQLRAAEQEQAQRTEAAAHAALDEYCAAATKRPRL